MDRTIWVAVAVAALAAGSARAQGFAGAEVSAELLGYTEDLDFGQTAYRGAAEFDAFAGFAIGADLSWHGFRALDADSSRNLTLHGLYDLGPATSAGLFWSQDSLDGDHVTTYGAEGRTTFGGAEVEGYLGKLDGAAADGMLAGIDARYAFGGFGVTGGLGLLNEDDLNATRVSAGAEYRLGLGPTLYGEVGRIDLEGEGSTFVALGARIAVGPQGGSTFRSRGIFEVLTDR